MHCSIYEVIMHENLFICTEWLFVHFSLQTNRDVSISLIISPSFFFELKALGIESRTRNESNKVTHPFRLYTSNFLKWKDAPPGPPFVYSPSNGHH